MVSFLLQQDQNKKFVIADPDTGWKIDRITFGEHNGSVYLSGEYHEMSSTPW
jgi:virulence-associated protein VapD